MSDNINEENLTEDIFKAERYGQYGDQVVEGVPSSAGDVLQLYANKYADGNVVKLQYKLQDQGFMVDEVVDYAMQNPMDREGYRNLKIKADSFAPEKKELKSAEDVFNATPVFAGKEGILTADISPDEYDALSMNRADPNYGKVLEAAEIFMRELPEAEQANMLSRPDGYEFDSGFLLKATETTLDKKGLKKGTEEYDAAYIPEYRRQINGFVAARTAGYHHGTLRVATSDLLEGQDWLSDVARAAGTTSKVIGHSKNGQPLFVEEGAVRHTLSVFDIPVSAVVGTIESGSPLEGIAQRKSGTTSLMQYGETTDIPGGKYLFGTAGLLFDIAMPDLASGAAGVVKGVSKGAKMLKGAKAVSGAASKATGLLPDLAITQRQVAAKKIDESAKLMREGVQENDPEKISRAQAAYEAAVEGKPDLARFVEQSLETVARKEETAAREALKKADDLTDDEKSAALDVLQSAGDFPIKRTIGVGDEAIPAGASPEVKKAFGDLNKSLEFRPGARRVEARQRVNRSGGKSDIITTAKKGADSIYNYGETLRRIKRVRKALEDQGYYVTDTDQFKELYKKALDDTFKTRIEELEALRAPSAINKTELADLKRVRATFKDGKLDKVGWLDDDTADALKTVIEYQATGVTKDPGKLALARKTLVERADSIVGSPDYTKGAKKQDTLENTKERFRKSLARYAEGEETRQQVLEAARDRLRYLQESVEGMPAEIARLEGRASELDKQRSEFLGFLFEVTGNRLTLRLRLEKLKAFNDKLSRMSAGLEAFSLDNFQSAKQLQEMKAALLEVGTAEELSEVVRASAAAYTKLALKRAAANQRKRQLESIRDILLSPESVSKVPVPSLGRSKGGKVRGAEDVLKYYQDQGRIDLDELARVTEEVAAADLRLSAMRKKLIREALTETTEAVERKAVLYAEAVRTEKAHMLNYRAARRRITGLRREAADLAKREASLSAEIAKVKAKITKSRAQPLPKIPSQILTRGAGSLVRFANARQDQQKLVETTLEIVEEAQRKVAEKLYAEGPLTGATKQLDQTERAVLLNANRFADTLSVVAEAIRSNRKVDDIFGAVEEAAEVAESVIRKEPSLEGSVSDIIRFVADELEVNPQVIAEGLATGNPYKYSDSKTQTQTVVDADYLARAALRQDVQQHILKNIETPDIPVAALSLTAQTTKASESLDKVLAYLKDKGKAGAALSYVASLFLGGQVHARLRNWNPFIRDEIIKVRRVVSQTIGDTAKFIEEENFEGLYRYMNGENATFDDGMNAFSSGNINVAGSVSYAMRKAIESLPPDEADALRRLFDTPLNESGTLDLERLAQTNLEGVKALAKLLNATFDGSTKTLTPKALDDLGEQAARDAKQLRADLNEISKDFKTLEDMPSGNFLRDLISNVQLGQAQPELMDHRAVTMLKALYDAQDGGAEVLLNGISRAYGGGENGLVAVARAAPLMTAHTAASGVMKRMGTYNLALSEKDYTQWLRFVQGEQVDREWAETVLPELQKKFGIAGQFARVDVMGDVMYLPSPVRSEMLSAVTRAFDKHAIVMSKTDNALEISSNLASTLTGAIYKNRILGSFMFRSPFGIDMMFESFEKGMMVGGLGPAAIHTVRSFSRIPSMFPGVLQAAHASQIAAKKLQRWLGPPDGPNNLDGVAGNIRRAVDILAERGGTEGLLRVSDALGEAMTRKIGEFVAAGRWNISTNKILGGSEEVININGKDYTYAVLREFFVETGVIGGSWQSNYFAQNLYRRFTGSLDEKTALSKMEKTLTDMGKPVQSVSDTVSSFAKAVTSYAESLSDRDRVSLAIAFMNSGKSPAEAARMVTTAVHDYSTQASSIDHNIFIQVLMPFWGFTKNNNRLQFDALFNPVWAYRSQMRRSMIKGAKEMLDEALADANADELGIQVQYMTDEEREQYDLLIGTLKQRLGVEQFTDDQKAVIKGMLVGVDTTYMHEGTPYEIDVTYEELTKIRNLIGASNYTINTPTREEITPGYYATRDIIVLPKSIKDAETAKRRKVGAPLEWNYIALPEPGQNAFIQHVSAMSDLASTLIFGPASLFGYNPIPDEKGSMALMRETSKIFSPDFHPAAALALKVSGGGTAEAARPMYIPAGLGELLTNMGLPFVQKVPAEVVEGVTIREEAYRIPFYMGLAMGFAPRVSGALKEVGTIERSFKIGTSGEPVYDTSLTLLKLAGIRVERSTRERVRRSTEPQRPITTTSLPYD